jgi:hypothetical protein
MEASVDTDMMALAEKVVADMRAAGRLHPPGERDNKLTAHLHVAHAHGVSGFAALKFVGEEMLRAEGVDDTEAARAASHAARRFDPNAPPAEKVAPWPAAAVSRVYDTLGGGGEPAVPMDNAFDTFLGLFAADDLVVIKTALDRAYTKTAAEWVMDGPPQTMGGCLQILPNPVWRQPTGGGGCANTEDMGVMKHVYVETDREEIKHKLLPTLLSLGLPVVAGVNTGGKSVHVVMRVEAEDMKEWRAVAGAMRRELAPLGLDDASFKPTQVMRLPGVRRVGTSDGKPVDADQTLIYFNPEAAALDMDTIKTAGRRAREAAAGAVGGTLPRLRAEDILTKPWARYIVRGMLCENSLAMIYGPSNVGKSFIALDLSCAMGSAPVDGPPAVWGPAGQRMYVVPSSVLYISLEGEDTLKGRVMALQASGRWGPHTRVDFVTISVDLFTEGMPELIAATAAATGEAWGVPCRLIVIDTLSRSIPGRDENSTEVMSQVVQLADRVRVLSNTCVLPVHHTGKEIERGARGAYALTCAVDTAAQVLRTPGGAISLQMMKQRGVALSGEHLMRLEVVEVGRDEWDEPITSCYVHHLTEEEVRELEATGEGLLRLLPQPGNKEWLEAAQGSFSGLTKSKFDELKASVKGQWTWTSKQFIRVNTADLQDLDQEQS